MEGDTWWPGRGCGGEDIVNYKNRTRKFNFRVWLAQATPQTAAYPSQHPHPQTPSNSPRSPRSTAHAAAAPTRCSTPPRQAKNRPDACARLVCSLGKSRSTSSEFKRSLLSSNRCTNLACIPTETGSNFHHILRERAGLIHAGGVRHHLAGPEYTHEELFLCHASVTASGRSVNARRLLY